MTANWRTARRAALAFGLASVPLLAIAQNPGANAYVPARQITGTIRFCGSPQMGGLLHNYETDFHKLQPQVRFEHDLQSTITAVSGIYTGRADIGLLGREIWPSERQAFESVKGYPPSVIDVATGSYDVPKATFALMIFVPRSNPLATISISQLALAFGGQKTAVWGDLGLRGGWAEKPIHLYAFSRDNDKARFFSKRVFQSGESWKTSLHEFSNGAGKNGADAGELVIRAVEADPDGIGISNIHYATPNVRALPISSGKHDTPIEPVPARVADRSYPLSRAIYMVFDSRQRQSPSDALVEFMRFVLSRQGQQAVRREGNYLPLTPAIAARELRRFSGKSEDSP
jgi:phosphate transport system substrate-binding protein